MSSGTASLFHCKLRVRARKLRDQFSSSRLSVRTLSVHAWNSPCLCIIPLDLSYNIDHDSFTSLRAIRGDPNDKLTQLHKIRDQRMAEPPGSTHRMAAMCCLIPESIESLDLDSYRYHRQCYQCFQLNLNRLKGYEASDQATTSERHHSPGKLSSSEGRDIYASS